ncbi:Hcp family type VI secretion system effector [Oryzomicrobium sp.]|uniref:Hcp family type VI secretion system effector n=1 Tax=Oryzomicrobium sp. TaxID=1911578 RepID=UPI002FE03444
MAFDAFLKIDGIPGESTDDKHKDWIEIAHFDHKMDQPASATASSAGGATAERVNHGTFNIVHLLDKASPKIYEACCTGKHINDVTLELCRAGGDKVKYMEVKLEQVLISKVESHGTSAEGFPNEAVSFSYGKIKWIYTQQKRADGAGGGNVSAGWDLTANKTIA